MAEALMLVCDECGRPDATTVTIRTGTANYVKDLCEQHLRSLLANTRAPRRGRPKARSRVKAAARAAAGTKKAGGRGRKTRARKPTALKKASASK